MSRSPAASTPKLGSTLDVEAFREHARDLGELLRLATAPHRLREEACVAHGHRGLGGERGEELAIVGGGQVLLAQAQGEHAEQLVAGDDGDAREREEAVGDRPLAAAESTVRRHVLDEEGLTAARDEADATRVDAYRHRHVVKGHRRDRRPRPAHE
jgi:hypothetical protein